MWRNTPKDSRGKWRRQGYDRSIELRIIDYQIPGFPKSSIVTNVLDPQVVSREDWVGLAVDNEPGRNLAPGLYHRRWEIETTYRELKVEQGMEGHLRGRTPGAIRFKIASHVVPLRPGCHYPRPKDTKTKSKGYGHRQQPGKLKTKSRPTTQKKAA